MEVEAPITDESVDTKALKQDILKAIKAGATGQRKAPYRKTRTGEKGTTDLGGTYVEVDLDKQHLYLYVNGKKKAEGDICSGSVADGCATPAGLYTIKTKDYDRYLVGEGYQDWVHYFMPFNGGIGLHASTWREADEYGGSWWPRGTSTVPWAIMSPSMAASPSGRPRQCGGRDTTPSGAAMPPSGSALLPLPVGS